jgi:hypothetical protein
VLPISIAKRVVEMFQASSSFILGAARAAGGDLDLADPGVLAVARAVAGARRPAEAR